MSGTFDIFDVDITSLSGNLNSISAVLPEYSFTWNSLISYDNGYSFIGAGNFSVDPVSQFVIPGTSFLEPVITPAQGLNPRTYSVNSLQAASVYPLTEQALYPNLVSRITSWEQKVDAFIKAICLNLRSTHISHYDNYNFNSFAIINGRMFGTSQSGLFEIDNSDTDAGQPINAYYQTGKMNLARETHNQAAVIKRLRENFLVYEGQGSFKLDLIDENGQNIYDYDIIKQSGDHFSDVRVKFARGLRQRTYSFKLSNVDGAAFEVKTWRVLTESIQHRRR
jgi:hypothetical protein